MNLSLSSKPHTPSKSRLIAYWTVTAFVTFELIYGALWDFNLLNKGYVYAVLTHLGYPLYLGSMLGACKLAATVIFLIPGFLLLKEWAYTGVVILFMGGFVSLLQVGDGPDQFIYSLLFGALTIASWALRPANRRIVSSGI